MFFASQSIIAYKNSMYLDAFLYSQLFTVQIDSIRGDVFGFNCVKVSTVSKSH